MRHVHTVTKVDVGPQWITIQGKFRTYPGGCVLDTDVGKKVFECPITRVLQVENQEQMERRRQTEKAKVVRDARNLSSGTICALTGNNKYAEIDRTQRDFVTFIQNSPKHYVTWQEAWEDFYDGPE